jgi:hypothetical protein
MWNLNIQSAIQSAIQYYSMLSIRWSESKRTFGWRCKKWKYGHLLYKKSVT